MVDEVEMELCVWVVELKKSVLEAELGMELNRLS